MTSPEEYTTKPSRCGSERRQIEKRNGSTSMHAGIYTRGGCGGARAAAADRPVGGRARRCRRHRQPEATTVPSRFPSPCRTPPPSWSRLEITDPDSCRRGRIVAEVGEVAEEAADTPVQVPTEPVADVEPATPRPRPLRRPRSARHGGRNGRFSLRHAGSGSGAVADTDAAPAAAPRCPSPPQSCSRCSRRT